ncbi:MAG: L-aspartate oxidase [Candidatus Ancillula sp.]|jgi:L-aspartate oxidase|nr:L-aspartate oxidase [Candidatus Ancillula sp.]
MMDNRAKVIVVGSGLAGSRTAQFLQEYCDVTLLTKGELMDANSALAQGGIAAALNTGDSVNSHFADSMLAGGNESDKNNLKILIREGRKDVKTLIQEGMEFDRNADGSLNFGLEGAHSTPRIVHAGGDFTGKKVLEFVQSKFQNIRVITNAFVSELLVRNTKNGSEVYGVRFLDKQNREMIQIADFVVIATGGLGKMYKFNTNSSTVCADGFALAKRAGAKLRDMEFVQFHPTLLKSTTPILISEAVRGAGAKLVNSDGDYFMKNKHKYEDLAPRDIVSREITREITLGKDVFLDASACANFEKRFPFIAQKLKENDIRRDRIPIIPAAHFFMGGVTVDSTGRSNLRNLYAVGEVASTRAHGANRLASNSLLECLVFSRRVAQDILSRKLNHNPEQIEAIRATETSQIHVPSLMQIQEKASCSIGIIKKQAKLRDFMNWLSKFDTQKISTSKEINELENLVLVAREICAASLKRSTSLGAHYIEVDV